jgi:hypothetical protein
MTYRIEPASAPYPESVQVMLDKLTPEGEPPLTLFTTLARDERLFGKFMAGGLLDRGHLTLRQREIVIDRVTAQCRSEYEWGVHVNYFATHVRLNESELYSLVHGTHADACWQDPGERLLIELCDALHTHCSIGGELWQRLVTVFSDETLLELFLLCGFYRTVSYLTNGAKLPLETNGARFPKKENQSGVHQPTFSPARQ